MEPQMNTDERKQARFLAECDRYIEGILAEHDDEVKAFVRSDAKQFPHVRALVHFSRARRVAMIEQLEHQHCDCERENVEKVATWGYTVAFGLAIGAVALAIFGLGHLVGHLVRWLWTL
jgi:hypothetical protein